jgi:hypothetical protein
MSSLLHLGNGDIPHFKFIVGCFALLAIITVLKTSWTTRTLPEKDTKANPVITDELSGPSRLYTNWN